MTIKEYLNALCNFFRYVLGLCVGTETFQQISWTTDFLNSLFGLKIVLCKYPICFTALACSLSVTILCHVFGEKKVRFF